MILKSVILTILLAEVVLVNGNAEDSTCELKKNFEIIKEIRKQVQNWKTVPYAKSFHFINLLDSVYSAAMQYSEFTKNCTTVEVEAFINGVMMASSIIADDVENAEFRMSLLEDDEYITEIVGLFCAINSSYFLNFVQKMKYADTKIRLYNVMSDLLMKTDVNNTEIITTMPFIETLNEAANREKKSKVRKALKGLLEKAIQADLVLQHDNIEHLHSINKTVTDKVIQDLIMKYIHMPINDEHDLAIYPLFEILKCTNNTRIWVNNLITVHKMLQDNNKMRSEYSLLLLKAVESLQKNNNVEEQEQLQHIVTNIPDFIHKVLKSKFCLEIENSVQSEAIFLTYTNGEYQSYKFVPNAEGSKVLLLGESEGYNFTLFTDAFDPTETFFDHFEITLRKELGEFVELPNNIWNIRQPGLHICVPLELLLPPTDLSVELFDIFKKFVQIYSRPRYVESSNDINK